MKLTTSVDNLWRDVVKLRAGHQCERCGRREELHSHHIIKRTYHPTRHLLDNGICLCAICHGIAHDQEEIFKLWVAKRRPLKELEEKKHSQEKIDLYLEQAYLLGAKYAYTNQPKLSNLF